MKQNIIKLVKLQGGTPTTKAGDWFSRQAARESAFESMFGKKSTSPSNTKTDKDSKGQPSLFSTLIASVGNTLGAGLTSLGQVISGALTTLGSVITQAIATLGTIIAAKGLAGSIPDIDLPDKGKPGGGKTPSKTPPAGASKGGAMRNVFKWGSRLSVGAGLMLYSPELGDGTLDGAALKELSEENKAKYNEMLKSGDKAGANDFLRKNSPKYFGNNTSPTPANAEAGKDFDYKKYTDLVATQESGSKGYTADNGFGFLGRYQFGAKALETYGYLKPGSSSDDKAAYYPQNWTGKDGIKSKDDFINNASIQEKLMQEYTAQHIKQLNKSGVLQENMTGADVASRLYAAHHGGVGGANALFLRGESRGDKYLSGANTGKSATTMASLYSGGAAPSGSTIGRNSVAIASTNTPSSSQPVVVDNKTINNTQVASSGGGSGMTAYDQYFGKYLINRTT